VPGALFEAARQVTIPLQFLLQWDDEGMERQPRLDLFDAFGTKEKTLHANLGRHAGVPWFEVDDAARFFARHLKRGRAVRPAADCRRCRQDAPHRGQVPALINGGSQQMHNRPDRGGTSHRRYRPVGAALGHQHLHQLGPRREALGPHLADRRAGDRLEHGLWLARQVADEMSVVSGPGGTCAMVVFALR
jgi:hypothetical protein